MDAVKMREMIEQAQQMQDQMQHKLAQTVVEATSGGGVVTVKMNGEKKVLSLRIDPMAVAGLSANAADVEMLEDLVVAAMNEAARRVDDLAQSGIAGMLGELHLPEGLL